MRRCADAYCQPTELTHEEAVRELVRHSDEPLTNAQLIHALTYMRRASHGRAVVAVANAERNGWIRMANDGSGYVLTEPASVQLVRFDACDWVRPFAWFFACLAMTLAVLAFVVR